MLKTNSKIKLLIAGGIIGLIAVLLVLLGNPKNMGFCIACFLRDTAGAVSMHQANVVQYIRPEVIGLVLGAFLLSVAKKEFLARGGSSPMIRLVLGAVVMIGALVFLGCPFRMILRMAGGDLSAIVGLIGFIFGIGVGVFFLNRGYSLKRTHTLPTFEGALFPIFQIAMLLLLVISPSFLMFSESGPGSMHAPIAVSLIAGLVVGGLAQRTRLCMAGGIRDVFLFKDWTMLVGIVSIFIFALLGNLVLNQTVGGFFTLSFTGQPIAHNDGLWNFLSMCMVGWGSVLLGGCPMRQLVMAGEGNSDSAVTIIGLMLGAGIAHNFKLASAAQTITDGVVTGGPTVGGKIAVVVGTFILLAVALVNTVTIVSKSKEEITI